MPKDNEKIPLPNLDALSPSEMQAFAPDQMVCCGECLRANPPTKVNCLYCGAVLLLTQQSASLQKPTLRRLEKWEHGYNNILVPDVENSLAENELRKAADFLRLGLEDFKRIISVNRPLPLARAASANEATLIFRRLSTLGLNTIIVSDQELRVEESSFLRIRSVHIDEEGITGYQIAGDAGTRSLFSEQLLLVSGRLVVKRVEVKESKSGRGEDDILDASQFFRDEAVLDIYWDSESQPWRIAVGSFDFSVLGARKRLVTSENLATLRDVIREHAPQAKFDDSYNSMRQALEPIWPAEQRTEAGGVQRQRPGKVAVGGITESSNEAQFTRYSRLQHFLRLNPLRLS